MKHRLSIVQWRQNKLERHLILNKYQLGEWGNFSLKLLYIASTLVSGWDIDRDFNVKKIFLITSKFGTRTKKCKNLLTKALIKRVIFWVIKRSAWLAHFQKIKQIFSLFHKISIRSFPKSFLFSHKMELHCRKKLKGLSTPKSKNPLI